MQLLAIISLWCTFSFALSRGSAEPQQQRRFRPPAKLSVDFSPTGYLVAVPMYKLAVCLVAKNSLTSSNTFLLRTIGYASWASTPYVYDAPGMSTYGKLSAELQRAVFDSPEWTRVIVVRDPVSRFASTLLDKCGRVINEKWPCPVRLLGGKSGSAHDVLDFVERSLAHPNKNALLDTHWHPVTSYCGLGSAATRSTFNILNFSSLEEGWVRVAETARGIPDDKRALIVRYAHEVFGRPEMHRGVAHKTSSSELVRQWVLAASNSSDPDYDMIPRIRAAYAMDYAAFNL
jgi:hypothetical protein